MELLLSVANAGLIITFFSCDQSTFMQWYSVALNKRLISATVHAGKRPEFPGLPPSLFK